VTDNSMQTAESPDSVAVSAVYLAAQAGVRQEDVHYFARKRLIRNRRDGSKTPYYLGDLQKIRLMKLLRASFTMEVAAAARLADELLDLHQREPDAYRAALSFVSEFEKSLTVLSRLLVDLGFNEALQQEDCSQSVEMHGDPP